MKADQCGRRERNSPSFFKSLCASHAALREPSMSSTRKRRTRKEEAHFTLHEEAESCCGALLSPAPDRTEEELMGKGRATKKSRVYNKNT